jgi:deazaflavin-dependent oxidoreductase (nitroreductase family)
VRKQTVAKPLAKYVASPPLRALFALGVPVPGSAILETVGRRSGLTRTTPVTDGLDGGVFWIVAEHGHHAAYVRNLEANPRVRVQIGRRWRTGTARTLPDDDPYRRLRAIAGIRSRSIVNLLTVRLMGTDLLTVRIDLDP